MPLPIKPLAKHRGTELSAFAESERIKIDRALHDLRTHDRDLFDVSAALGVHRKTLTRWRTGETEAPASALPALMNLLAEFGKKAVSK